MHPYIIDGVLSSYSLMLIVGIFAALGLFKLLTKLTHVSKEVYDFYSTTGIIAIAVGLCSAFLFQSVYNFFETGVFKISGLTFMGGLIGGVATFILITLLTRKKRMRAYFFTIAELAIVSVVLAHAIGRIGCFLAGCCYGIRSEHGIKFPNLPYKVIPTQLYEAIFLFILFAALMLIVLKFKRLKGFNLIIYGFAYSVFRFIIEFYRGDPRGAYVGPFSPSQFQSIILFLVACALLFLRLKRPDIFLPVEESPSPEAVAAGSAEESTEVAVENDCKRTAEMEQTEETLGSAAENTVDEAPAENTDNNTL